VKDTPLLLKVTEAAKLLQLGRDRIYELVASGRLPALHFGRKSASPAMLWLDSSRLSVATTTAGPPDGCRKTSIDTPASGPRTPRASCSGSLGPRSCGPHVSALGGFV
jgi:excisionase family DNA binding protein